MTDDRPARTRRRRPSEREAPRWWTKERLGLLAAAVVFAIPFVFEFDGLSEDGHRVFAVFLMAVVLWVTEAIPLHATAALIITLLILLVSDQAVLSVGEDALPYADYFAALANPVLMLFLGGFFLAEGASKFRLDKALARVLLRPFGTSPSRIMLGMMLITAGFSMFMSNTATTATMMAVVIPVIATLPPVIVSAPVWRCRSRSPPTSAASAPRWGPRRTPSPSGNWRRRGSPSGSASGC
jgi:solute carrier family 13 (sodium-dependent dicarboxylate transporter), member 2/3/5